MSHSIGLCGVAGERRLPPQSGRPVLHPGGPFLAQLTPTLQTRLAGGAPDELLLGLLTQAAGPDGESWRELEAAGYARQPVALVNHDPRLWSVRTAASFDRPDTAEPVSHVGLFDRSGRLAYFGRLQGLSTLTHPANAISFRPCDVKVRRYAEQPMRRVD